MKDHAWGGQTMCGLAPQRMIQCVMRQIMGKPPKSTIRLRASQPNRRTIELRGKATHTRKHEWPFLIQLLGCFVCDGENLDSLRFDEPSSEPESSS